VDELRYQRVNTCAECTTRCLTRRTCDPVRGPLRSYGGIRFTSDGFDCALPVTIDSHSVCSFSCLYCFADNLIERREEHARPVGQTSLEMLEGIFSGRSTSKTADLFRRALNYDHKVNGYPCPVQLGGLTDPCDNIERQQGWLLRFMDMAIRHGQPVRMSTKGTLLAVPEYLDVLRRRPELFWVAFSIITPDDDLISIMDRRAPTATERLATMKELSRAGVTTSLRFRPMMPGISDSTPKHPRAWQELVDKATEAGAYAISCEVAFVPGALTVDLRSRWDQIERILRVPMRKVYYAFGPKQACTRPAAAWTEDILHAVTERARANGLQVGVSDPAWKQLNDHGCCCGIPPDHPVFGNWQREQATNALVTARDTGREVGVADIVPPWAYDVRTEYTVAYGAGPFEKIRRRREYWSDELIKNVDSLTAQRGVLTYFQGALQFARRDADGHAVYRYEGLRRRHPKHTPFWNVNG
jgi:DNA repair photolyase